MRAKAAIPIRRGLDIKVRFWSHVDKSGGPDACWPWIGSKAAGYGQFYISRGIFERGHRLAYIYTYGYDSIPDGMIACHKCDNPACCNPAHIFIGTYKDNSQDCKNKGRMRRGRKEKSPACAPPE